MIFKRVFRQAAAARVVNLPRAGHGETIVRSRNSESRPGRPLPGDYINAVHVSRRLRIGRCPPSFLAVLGSDGPVDGRVECHVGALACRRRGRERRYYYRKHTFHPPTSVRGFFVLFERKNRAKRRGRERTGEEERGVPVEVTKQLLRLKGAKESGKVRLCARIPKIRGSIHVDGLLALSWVLQSCSGRPPFGLSCSPSSYLVEVAPFFCGAGRTFVYFLLVEDTAVGKNGRGMFAFLHSLIFEICWLNWI